MSYELDRTTKYKCPCGKGYINEGSYSNDWFQSYETHSIMCDECKGKYHIEIIQSVGAKPGRESSTPYLVPIGESLDYDRSGIHNFRDTPFHIQLCMGNSKTDLQQSYEVLKNSKYYSRLEDSKAIKVCNMSKDALKTVKIKTVLPYVIEAIEKYDDVENNYEKNMIRIEKEKSRVVMTKEKSICVYSLDRI